MCFGQAFALPLPNNEIMKNLKNILVLGIGMMISAFSYSQVNVQVNINSQPDWGPVGYQQASYYYLQEIDMYYSVQKRQYIYLQGGQWIWVNQLPSHCRNYNLYSGYKVVFTGSHPYQYHHQHKVKYKKYKNYHGHQKANKHNKGNSHNFIQPQHGNGKVNYKGDGHKASNNKGYKDHGNKGQGGKGGGKKK